MKPETERFLSKARDCLTEARALLSAAFADAAGRAAYLAAFHAAQALLFEREERIVKTHNGVHTEWQRLTRDDAEVDKDLRNFLSRSFRFKMQSDYGLDPSQRTTGEQASVAIATAQRLIALVETKLAAA